VSFYAVGRHHERSVLDLSHQGFMLRKNVSDAASDCFPLRLVLVSALGQEVLTDPGAAHEEAVPRLTEGRDDALIALGAYLRIEGTIGRADVLGDVDSAEAVIDENGTVSHASPSCRVDSSCMWQN